MSTKLQKVLAGAGLGSRREMERWIEAGRIKVNALTAEVGQRVEPDDDILVDGQPLVTSEAVPSRLLLMNKESGVICTRKDPERRPSCFDSLPALKRGRWISIGRLDINTSGLLLFTNDGDFANRFVHPSRGLDREYAVRVDRMLNADEIDRMTQGILFDDGLLKFTDIRYFDGSGNNHWYHVVVMEGKNREVRRLFESQGLRISRLKRVRFGPVVIPSNLTRGSSMELDHADVSALYALVGLEPELPRKNRKTGTPGAKRGAKSVIIPYPGMSRVPADAKTAVGASGESGIRPVRTRAATKAKHRKSRSRRS